MSTKPQLPQDIKDLFENIDVQMAQPKRKGGAGAPRKNLGAVTKILNLLAERGITLVTSGQIWSAIQKVGPEKIGFELNQDALRMDQHGPTRSIGDILGGHGLKLEKAGRGQYTIPDGGITNDYLKSIGLNPNHKDFS